MQIDINPGQFKINESVVQNTIQKTLQKLQELKKITAEQSVEISVAVVSREEIQEINKKWRGKDEETDVLSFCYENHKDILEGEVVLCLDIIRDNAKEDDIEVEEELRKNVIHSILHIAGYEHGDEMFKVQAEINR